MPFRAMIVRDAIPAFLSIVAVAVVVYIATWSGWFLTDGGWDRNWADSSPIVDSPPLRSLWHYHAEAWNFPPIWTLTMPTKRTWGWPFQARPTSFFMNRPPTRVMPTSVRRRSSLSVTH